MHIGKLIILHLSNNLSMNINHVPFFSIEGSNQYLAAYQ